MHGVGRYVDAGGGYHDGRWVKGACPEVDFAHLPESGNFRYCFSVRRVLRLLCTVYQSVCVREGAGGGRIPLLGIFGRGVRSCMR